MEKIIVKIEKTPINEIIGKASKLGFQNTPFAGNRYGFIIKDGFLLWIEHDSHFLNDSSYKKITIDEFFDYKN